MELESFIYGAISLALIAIILASFGFLHLGKLAFQGFATGDSAGSTMPEKCRPPAGQDVQSWKEHLGHHAETRECLKYYN